MIFVDEKLSSLIKQIKLLENEKETQISNQQRLNTLNQNLEAEKRELQMLLDKRLKETDRLNEEWKSLNLKLTESESNRCELTAKLEEMQKKEQNILFREKQYELDKQRLLNEIEWLNQQLKEKSSQLLDVRSNLNKRTYELESSVEDLSAENSKLKSQVENLQTANEKLEAQNDELTNKIQEVREREVQARMDFNEESVSREKLIELYKEENESAMIKLKQAAENIVELEGLVKEIKDEYAKLANEKEICDEKYEAKLKENDETIAKLEQELKNANELLSIAKRKGATVLSESDIEQLSPAAAVASRLLKSGMSLTQIYSEYVNLTENLQSEKSENERLKSYISELIKDIEEKAPILKRQKVEYEEAMKTINNLTTQLENSMMDYEVLKSKSEDSIKKYNSISSENIRLKQDVADLSRQVSVLLHEIEKLRSKLVGSLNRSSLNLSSRNLVDQDKSQLNSSLNVSNMNDDTGEVTSSTEATSKSLFLFRNIEELQKQNQELVRLVHEMRDKKQSEEKQELELKTREYYEKLNLAVRELEEIRVQRQKQEQICEEIIRQRDNYKELLIQQQQQIGENNPRASLPSFYTSTPGDFSRTKKTPLSELDNQDTNNHLKAELNETNHTLEKLQKHFEKYQEEMIKTNKMLSDENENYRVNTSDLTLKLALSESKLESAVEKIKALNTSNEKLRKDLETAKERGSKFNELIIKHEQSINITTLELNRSKERISELETKLHSLTVERDLYRSNQERLSKEQELLVRENSSRNSILANLELIKNNFERSERETKSMLTEKIQQLGNYIYFI